MRILAWFAEQLAGPWLKSLVVPALFLAVLTAAHQYSLARAEATAAKETALVAQGRNQCLAEVELAQTKALLDRERRNVELARSEAAAAQNVAQMVGDNVRVLEAQLAEAQSRDPGSNPGCLSDGMRQRLWGTGGGGDEGQRSGSGTGSPARRAP